MKHFIIGHPIQTNFSHIQPFVYAAWQRFLCSALIYGIQLPGKWDWKMLLHYSRKGYSNHVTERLSNNELMKLTIYWYHILRLVIKVAKL